MIALALASVLALTDVDDARACAPLHGGGFAAATGGGLVVVGKDGASKVMTSLDGLPETRVHAVATQGDGLWVGTEAGAALVVGGKVARTVGSAPVHAIHVRPDGSIVLGTRGHGVFRLASKDAPPELLPNTAKGTRASAIAEHDGAIYVAYADGPVAKLDRGVLRDVAGSPTHGQSLASTPDGLVVGDLEGVYRQGRDGFTSIASVDARGLAAQGSKLFAATYGTGLVAGGPHGLVRGEAGVPRQALGVGIDGAARCVATTSGLWVDEGAGAFRKITVAASLPSNDVTALAENGKRVAVGTFDHGAAIVDDGRVTMVAGVPRNETVTAAAWQGDTLWLATVHGLVRVGADGRARTFTSHDGLPSTFVRSIAVVSNEEVLVGTESGPALVRQDRVTSLVEAPKGAPRSIASPMHATWAVAVGAGGVLFVGTAAGLYYGKNGAFERASLASGELPDDWVTALAIDGKDVVVGTYAKGVVRLRFEPGQKPRAVALGGGYVNPGGLALRDGKIWAATMDGLLFRPKDDDRAPWATDRGAAPGRDVTAVRFVGGARWVASRRGIGVAP